ncbi:hypothetical protein CPLU01_06811 [Colletotrichum plurivorum]|uniref:Ankyrin repeat protein n=1 Tax=Colletotrichum plurivorum TaxID=2175906 RepID=A0A8H6NF89_9PEZI|nr:hypothetical protein CPLU01_06811 [Colletotrichum plurivorum]
MPVEPKQDVGSTNQQELNILSPCEPKRDPIPWKQSSFWGGYSFQNLSKEHPSLRGIQARVYLPSWLSRTAWDFEVYRSCIGWKMFLKPWRTRPRSAPVFKYAYEGLLPELLEAFDRKEASPFDRDPHGRTLLHVCHAAYVGRSNMVKALIGMGLSLEDTNVMRETPLQIMGVGSSDASGVVELYRFLAQTDEIQTTLQAFHSMPEDACRSPDNTSFHHLLWKIPNFLSVLPGEQRLLFNHLPLSIRFAHLKWYHIDAQVVLDHIQSGADVDPAEFRCAMPDMGGSSLQSFVQAYFASYFRIFRARMGRHCGMIYPKRAPDITVE